jgi:hypothetical protein
MDGTPRFGTKLLAVGWMSLTGAFVMTDKQPDPTSDAARTGNEADKGRDELKKKAEEGLKNATRQLPKGGD